MEDSSNMNKAGYPMVSVVMPSYNAERYIYEAVESILNQDYPNFELVIVDDASTDSTADIIGQFQDKRLKFFRNSSNHGIAYTTNKAIGYSSGWYIALMDDDDISLPQRLSVEVDFLQNHLDIAIVGSSASHINEEGKLINTGGTPHYNPKYIKAWLLFHCLDFHNGTAMMRREIFTSLRLSYRDGCHGMQDYFFYIQASKKVSISSIDECLMKYRIHDKNTTNLEMDKNKIIREKLYSAFQYYSLLCSGFTLKPVDRRLLTSLLRENGYECRSWYEFCALRSVLIDILNQAVALDIDWYDELEIVCKQILGRAMRRIDDFIRGELVYYGDKDL